MKQQKVIITIQFILSIILNAFRHDDIKQIASSVIFQLIIASFGGLLISFLMQYYKKGQWLKYWIWVYSLLLFYNFIDAIGMLS